MTKRSGKNTNLTRRQVLTSGAAAAVGLTVFSSSTWAQAKKINADADATVVRTVGDADASKTRAVGSAEAEVMKLKIASMESGNYAMVQIAEALAKDADGGVRELTQELAIIFRDAAAVRRALAIAIDSRKPPADSILQSWEASQPSTLKSKAQKATADLRGSRWGQSPGQPRISRIG